MSLVRLSRPMRLGLLTLTAAVIVVLATLLPAPRAAAVLNGLALISAVVLGYSAWQASQAQARQAELATFLQHRPILVPLHEAPAMQIPLSSASGLDGA